METLLIITSIALCAFAIGLPFAFYFVDHKVSPVERELLERLKQAQVRDLFK